MTEGQIIVMMAVVAALCLVGVVIETLHSERQKKAAKAADHRSKERDPTPDTEYLTSNANNPTSDTAFTVGNDVVIGTIDDSQAIELTAPKPANENKSDG